MIEKIYDLIKKLNRPHMVPGAIVCPALILTHTGWKENVPGTKVKGRINC